jgi:hypothetical protein
MPPNAPSIPDARFAEDGDWIARRFFSPDDLRLSPDEYVARHAHALGSFSFHLYRYSDPALGTWVRRVGELLAEDGGVERCQESFLSPKELADVRRQQAEGL